jgi:hypothetical protein
MPRETSVTHGASKRLLAMPFGTETASFMVVMAPVTWVSCAAGTVHRHPLGGASGIPVVPTECMCGLNGRGLKIRPVKKLFSYREPLGWPFVPRPQDGARVKTKASTRCCKELSACCAVMVPRMLFSY